MNGFGMNGFGWRNPALIGLAALFVAILAAATFSIVPETQQAVVVRFREPVRTVNRWQPGQAPGESEAGLIARWPFIDRIIWVDRRVLDLDLDNATVRASDQTQARIDAVARFRVVDPSRLVAAAGTVEGARKRLTPIFVAALRDAAGRASAADLLSGERNALTGGVQAVLTRDAAALGVAIVDVTLTRTGLPAGQALDGVLTAMQRDREQEGGRIAALGLRDVQLVQAQADADAARIYADAFGKDPGFYDFYRAMQSYRRTFGADGGPAGSTSFVLGPDNAYLREFAGRGR